MEACYDQRRDVTAVAGPAPPRPPQEERLDAEEILSRLEARLDGLDGVTADIVSGTATRELTDTDSEVFISGRISWSRGRNYQKRASIWVPNSKELELILLENVHLPDRDAYKAVVWLKHGSSGFIAFQDDRKRPEIFQQRLFGMIPLAFSLLVTAPDIGLHPRALLGMGAELEAVRIRREARTYIALKTKRLFHLFGTKTWHLTWLFDAASLRFERLEVAEEDSGRLKTQGVVECRAHERVGSAEIGRRFALTSLMHEPESKKASAELVLGRFNTRPEGGALELPAWATDRALPQAPTESVGELRVRLRSGTASAADGVSLLTADTLDLPMRMEAGDVAALRGLLEASPDSPLLNSAAYAASTARALGQELDPALPGTLIRGILERKVPSPDACALHVLMSLATGNPEGALKTLDAAGLDSFDPNFARDSRFRARSALLKSPEEAIALVAKECAGKSAQEKHRWLDRMARRKEGFLAGRTDSFLAAFEKSGVPELEIAAARAWMDRPQYERAAKLYGRASRNAESRVLLEPEIDSALRQVIRHAWQAAASSPSRTPLLEWAEEATRTYPGSAAMKLHLADVHYAERRYDDAIRGYGEGMAAEGARPLEVDAYREYRAAGSSLASPPWWLQQGLIAKVTPDSATLVKLAAAWSRKGDPRGAVPDVERALRKHAASRAALEAYAVLEMPDRAAGVRKAILLDEMATNGSLVPAYAAELARFYLSTKRLEEAYFALEALLQALEGRSGDDTAGPVSSLRDEVSKAYGASDVVRAFLSEEFRAPSDDVSGKARKLIERLGADEIETREQADKELRAMGRDVAPGVAGAIERAGAEPAFRLRAILSAIAHDSRRKRFQGR
jgi:tetratricopeptide (TPR) repeat protein